MEIRKIISETLRAEGLSVRRACRIMDIHYPESAPHRPQTWTDWLSGKKGLTVSNLEKLLTVLNKTIELK